MSEPEKSTQSDRRRGQSLVEVALFLPLLVFMIAGLVEVANLLVTQNRVTTASRIAAGYGATYITDEDRANWLAPAPIAVAMGDTALNAVTETLELAPELWDIWSIYGVTNDAGEGQADGWAVFTHTQVYGANAVVSDGDWEAMQAQIQADVLAELQAVAGADTANMEVVAAADFHNIDTILGLPVWQWVGVHRIRGLTVMRVSERPPYVGCPVLPITVHLDQWSLYPNNWNPNQPLPHDPRTFLSVEDDIHPLPYNTPNRFTHDYADANPANNILETSATLYPNSLPGVPLSNVTGPNQPYLFLAREKEGAGGFGWLDWRGNSGTTELRAMLDFPGNFLDPVYGYPGSPADTIGNTTPSGFATTLNGDGNLEIGEWIPANTGNRPAVRDYLSAYVTGVWSEWPITLLMYQQQDGQGNNLWYKVEAFITLRLTGYHLQSNDTYMVFEFIRWGSECLDAIS